MKKPLIALKARVQGRQLQPVVVDPGNLNAQAGIQVGQAAGGVDQVDQGVGEAIGLVTRGLGPPGVEPASRRHVLRHPGVEEDRQLLVAGQQVTPRALLQCHDLGDAVVVGPDERVALTVPVAVDQRVAQEHRARPGPAMAGAGAE